MREIVIMQFTKYKKPLYVFVHLPKCGGTTIKKHLRNNYKPDEIASVMLTWDYCEEERKKIHESFMTMPQEQKDKLKCLYGMNVWYDIKDCFPTREVRFVTIMREPWARAVSHYRFNVSRTGQERPLVLVWDNELLNEMADVNGGIICFDGWLQEVVKYPNFIHRYLDRLGFHTVEQFYFIGLTENSKNDFAYLYHLLGMRRFFADMNITSKAIQIDITRESKDLFYSNNELDALWYNNSVDYNDRFYRNCYEAVRVINKLLIRKKVYIFLRKILLKLPFSIQVSIIRKIKKEKKKK